MVSAILLHYVIDDPLPTRGTFGDPGTNSGADNFFFFLALNVFLFSYMLSSFSTCSYYLNCFSTWYVWLLLDKLEKKRKERQVEEFLSRTPRVFRIKEHISLERRERGRGN